MAAYCLPKQYASAFLKALGEGGIDPAALADMTSAQRRKFFEPIVGAENAKEVNTLFESKLLLKNRQQGFITWAKNVAGLSEPARRDIISRINRMPEGILNPATEEAFLADLAEKKLGVSVSADEAEEIFNLAKAVEDAKSAADVATSPAAWTKYGRAKVALTDRLEEMKPGGRTLGQLLLEVINLPRSTMATLDLSAPLQQGWGMEASGNWRDAFVRMHTYLASEEGYQDLRGWIAGHPEFDLIESSGLSLTELGTNLSAREEAIQSSLVEKAFEYGITRTTGIPNAVRASNRAYTGYLNYVRFKTMVDWIAAARLAGEDVSAGSKALKDLASTINNFSGRGNVGSQKGEQFIAALNALFFSPRKFMGTVQMFNPAAYLNWRKPLDPLAKAAGVTMGPARTKMARIKGVKMLLGAMLYTGAAIGLAKALGADVELNPLATDFLRIPIGIGDRKFDVSGGNATWLRFLARFITGSSINSQDELQNLGEGYRADGRAGLMIREARNKLAPFSAGIADALYGKDPLGRPFSLTAEMQDKLIPMTIGDIIDFAYNDPGDYAAIVPTLAAMYGVSVSAPIPGFNSSKRDVWGQPKGTDYGNDQIERTLRRIGIHPEPLPRKIRGVELTPEQYDVYQQIAGQAMRRGTAAAIRTQGFERYSLGKQEDMIRDSWRGRREDAINVMLGKYGGQIRRDAERLQKEIKTKGSTAARQARGEVVR